MSDPVAANRMPTLFIPHGGGPCFFMDWTQGPADTWDRMEAWLRSLGLFANELMPALNASV